MSSSASAVKNLVKPEFGFDKQAPHNHFVGAKVTLKEKQLLSTILNQMGLSQSEFLRQAIHREAETIVSK